MRYGKMIVFLLLSLHLQANDSLIVSRLLQRIDLLQAKDDRVFPKGSIPSYRLYSLNQERYKADINPFFTGLIGFTLRDIAKDLTPVQQVLANTIMDNMLPVFPKFRNRSWNRDTYNFWPTDTPKIFPNSGWLNLFDKKQSLPDDLDDTVILLIAQKKNDSIAKAIHALMQEYTNNEKKRIRNTYPEYAKIGAYSTWFGQKMPVDFDVSVMTNILYFVQYYNLEWTAADSATLTLIEKVIDDKRHITSGASVSPHYATLPIILYHISRLMSLKPIASLELKKKQLIQDAMQALLSARTFMDQVILSTALLRWEVVPPELPVQKTSSLQDLVEAEDFSFFIANMASMLPNPYKKWMAATGVGKFYYYSPAYNNMLLLENLVWRKRRGLSNW